MRGFLGGARAEDFEIAYQLEQPFPCHNTVSNDVPARWTPDWRWCAGYLIARKNVGAEPRLSGAIEAYRLVEPSGEVVAGISEFVLRHTLPAPFETLTRR